MNFELSDDHSIIRSTIRQFVAKECQREQVLHMDEERKFPADIFAKIAEMGFCALNIPEEHGGVGKDTLGALIVAEELSTIYPLLATAYLGSATCGGRIVSMLGSAAQKAKYLPGLAEGSLQFTYGITEDDAGPGTSASTVSRPKARRVEGGYKVNGTLELVRMADKADHMLTLVEVEDVEGDDLVVLIVDPKSAGVSIEPIETVGYRGVGMSRVVLSDVLVPEENELGGLPKGSDQLPTISETLNLEVAACCVGIAAGAHAYALQYAKERVQFGRPIAEYGAIQSMLVDTATGIQAARLLTYAAGWASSEGRPCGLEAMMARRLAMSVARTAALNSVQILGGYGYADEYDAQRYLRDVITMMGAADIPEKLENAMGHMIGLYQQAR